MDSPQLRVAFGPVAPEFGSWNWLGADLAAALAGRFQVTMYTQEIPDCDVVVIIKFKPPLTVLRNVAQRTRVLYCPVDLYGSTAEIDADWEALRICHTIIVHCDRLTPYFAPYAPTFYLDHHLKFVAPMPDARRTDGPVLWVGNRANLPPVLNWWHRDSPPDELWILTDVLDGAETPTAVDLGISRGSVERWSPERHRAWTGLARGAIEIKGEEFRSRHKSPAKAHDFIASGVPIAMNPQGAAAEHLRRWGLEVALPEDRDRWFSVEYWEETQQVGRRLREELTLENCAARLALQIERVLEVR